MKKRLVFIAARAVFGPMALIAGIDAGKKVCNSGVDTGKKVFDSGVDTGKSIFDSAKKLFK